jgi:micrococcal nuclease
VDSNLRKPAGGGVFFLLLFLSFFFLAAVASILPQIRAGADSGSGVVVTVYDGDTIRIQFSDGSSERVRLIGVNSPELSDLREDVAFWAFLAKRFSFFYLYGQKVRLTYDQTRVDRYGRTLAYIWTDREKLFNEFIIRRGFAYVFLAFPFRSDIQQLFREAQLEARREERGLWRKDEPEVISSAEARSHLGKYIAVRFKCSSAEERRPFVYLSTEGRDFEALIPRNRKQFFTGLKNYLSQDLVVTGFLEEFKGRPQIVAFFPRQLRLAADQK